jgi:beta-glucosidase/6-phospho-beta-glucosidase/beta-galactosidase
LDVPGGPATSFAPAIALGRVSSPGVADNFFHDFRAVLAHLPGTVDGVRLGIEWARVEPVRGERDDAALARYAEMVSFAADLGLEVTLCLFDTAQPSWTGQDGWLWPWVGDAFCAHVRHVARVIPDVPLLLFADTVALVGGGYLHAVSPPWRRRARRDAHLVSRHLEEITARLREDALLRPRFVESHLTLDVAQWRGAGPLATVDEIYVRSVLRGHGPTAARMGLLQRGA